MPITEFMIKIKPTLYKKGALFFKFKKEKRNKIKTITVILLKIVWPSFETNGELGK